MIPHQMLPLFALIIAVSLVGCASNQQLQSANGASWKATQNATPEQSAVADNLWKVFERYKGTPYRYGGTSSSGFDCSGFITTAFDEALGRQLPRTTSQMLTTGETVATDQLRAGDLVFFRIKGKDQHAGIYMGGHSFIHSSSSVGVTHSSLNESFWRGRLSQVRRFE